MTASADLVPGANRITEWRFDVLDSDENRIGELGGAQVGGQVDWIQNAAVKGGGQMSVQDVGQEIDWLNVRIQPIVTLTELGPDPLVVEHSVGIFLPSAPVESWNELGRSWDVELHDKCSILDQDIWVDEDGLPTTYVAFAGENVIDLVRSLIAETGESSPALVDDPAAVLTSTLTWDVGTTRLQIVNDLLGAIGYFSLWVDGLGQFQASPYVEPAARAPRFSVMAPFEVGPTSLWTPEWTNDRDIYAIPNRFVAISQGDGETEALVASATNEDPASAYSYPSRGRWITQVDTDVEVASQAALETYAAMRLSQATSVTSTLTIRHAYLPGLQPNDVVRIVNEEAGLELLAVTRRTEAAFDELATVTSTFAQVVV